MTYLNNNKEDKKMEDVKMAEVVTDLVDNKITLKAVEIEEFSTNGTIRNQALMAMKENASKSGAVQVFMYRLMKQLSAIVTEMQEQRKSLIEDYALKDDKGQPINAEGPYVLSEENQKVYAEQVALISADSEEERIKLASLLAESLSDKDPEGKPIREKTSMVKIDPEKLSQFNEAFSIFIDHNYNLSIAPMQIKGELLDSLNKNAKVPILVDHMLILDKFFTFVS